MEAERYLSPLISGHVENGTAPGVVCVWQKKACGVNVWRYVCWKKKILNHQHALLRKQFSLPDGNRTYAHLITLKGKMSALRYIIYAASVLSRRHAQNNNNKFKPGHCPPENNTICCEHSGRRRQSFRKALSWWCDLKSASASSDLL